MSIGHLSISQLHELTGRDRRWLKRRLADARVEPVTREARVRRFDPRAALAAIYDAERADPMAERARLDTARAELAELDLSRRRGDLIPADQVEDSLVSFYGGVRMRLLAVPTKAAPEVQLAQTTAEAEEIVRRHQLEALEALAETPVAEICAPIAGSGASRGEAGRLRDVECGTRRPTF